MTEWCSHEDNPLPVNPIRAEETINVKEKGRYTNSIGKKKYEVQLQGQGLMALEKAAKLKHLTPNQYFREALEAALIRDGCLPSWWLTRQFKD
jgi:hypothetical protein